MPECCVSYSSNSHINIIPWFSKSDVVQETCDIIEFVKIFFTKRAVAANTNYSVNTHPPIAKLELRIKSEHKIRLALKDRRADASSDTIILGVRVGRRSDFVFII